MTAITEKTNRINIVQGEYFVTSDPNVVVSTLLGSCVAACIRDPLAGVGGINHFLLPGELGCAEAAMREGVHLMELLLNGLLKIGASRDRMEAKIFGGARTVRGLSDIGKKNAEFAEEFIRAERIVYKGGSIGGVRGRRIQYWPVSGRARQIMMESQAEFELKPNRTSFSLSKESGELELF